jgi:hypothetical protein
VSIIIHIPGKPRVSETLAEDDVLWRYLDAARFWDFLEHNTLFFCRGDQFEDKYEGAFTTSLKSAIEAAYVSAKIDYTYAEFKQSLRQRVFVNCWHRNRDDSMAMWRLYGRSPCAVAITTSVGRLKASLEAANLPFDLAIEKVEYVKHWRDPKLDIAPYSRVFAYKTKAYEYEKEVRVIVDRSLAGFEQPLPETGLSVAVSPSLLLRSVVISPESPRWFRTLVLDAANRYDLKAEVRDSKLSFEPI